VAVSSFSNSGIKSGSKRNKFWDQIAAFGDFESIATITAGSTVSSIEFTSIPSTYTHLQIRGIVRTTNVGQADEVQIQFNSDTATNYSTHQLAGSGSSATSSAAANNSFMYGVYTTGAAATANTFGSIVMDILDYKDTNKFKTMRNISGFDQNTSVGYVLMRSGNWRSTSAVTSIKLFGGASNIAQYSSFALYGIKG
jgi:hypothetical protein